MSKTSHRRFAAIFILLLSHVVFFGVSSAETTVSDPTIIHLKYVLKNGDTYDFATENRPDDVTDLKFYDGANVITGIFPEYRPNGIIRVNGYGVSKGTFSIERYGLVSDSGLAPSAAWKAQSKSEAIPYFSPQKAFLKPTAVREIIKDTPVYVIPVDFWRADVTPRNISAGNPNTLPKYSIRVNDGSDMLLQPDSVSTYSVDAAYLSDRGIILHEKALPNATNSVTLKVDGEGVNFMTITKRVEILGSVTETSYEQGSNGNFLVLKMENPRWIKDAALYEFKWNDTVITPSNLSDSGSSLSLGFWNLAPLVFKIPISSLVKWERVARITAKELQTSLFDFRTVALGDIVIPRIESVETTRNGTVVSFKVRINPTAISGDYQKLTIVLGGTGYTAQGEKVLVKNPDGTTKTDINGIESYEFVNALSFRKSGAGLEFEFPLNLLKEKGNTLTIKNGNSSQDSPEVLFDLGKSSVMESSAEAEKKLETVSFVKAEKTTFEYEPMAFSPPSIPIGVVKVENLAKDARYRLTAKFALKNPVNPFLKFDFSGTDPTIVTGDGKEVLFELSEERLWVAFSSSYSVTIQPNDGFGFGKNPVELELREYRLSKFSDGSFKTVTSGIGSKGYIVHSADFPGCFDSSGTYCGKEGLPTKSHATFRFDFGALPPPSIQSTTSSSTNGAIPSVPTVKKRNDPFALKLPWAAGTFTRLVYTKFSNTMVQSKPRVSSDPQARVKLLALKTAFDRVILSADAYEKSTEKNAKAFAKKRLVSDILSARKVLSGILK